MCLLLDELKRFWANSIAPLLSSNVSAANVGAEKYGGPWPDSYDSPGAEQWQAALWVWEGRFIYSGFIRRIVTPDPGGSASRVPLTSPSVH